MSEDDAGSLYEALIAGWNNHDGAEMAAPFAEDGVCIGYDGSQYVGRQVIATEIARIFADHEPARYVVKVESIRRIGDDAMLVRASAGMIPPGQRRLNPDVNTHHTVVAERSAGRWQVVLFQNTPAQFHGQPERAAEMTQKLQAVADAGHSLR